MSLTKKKVLHQSERLTVTEGGLPTESSFDKTGKCSAKSCRGKSKPKFTKDGWCWYCGEKKRK
ncbi:MAG: hypothetical protein KAJ19_22915 [Gammaproteobacteria bacterium]|nr:hypothetical protein [Gammaproteobacteria bacterium]